MNQSSGPNSAKLADELAAEKYPDLLDSKQTSVDIPVKEDLAISDQSQVDNAEENEHKPKSFIFKLCVFFLCVVTLVGAMDAVIVGSCLAAIAKDLKSTSSGSFWVGTAFLLGQTITIPIFGTTSEIFGRKWPILIALSIFAFGSILCATAKSTAWLIGARAVQGIGAGGMIQLVQVILSDISTMSERGLYMALAALAWSLGTNIGIPIGGAIGFYTTWRWIFWINLPICGICIPGLAFSLRLQQDTSSFMKKLGMIDWLGTAVFTCASTLFLVGITSGGVSHPWSSAAVLAPLIVGVALYLVFIYIEWRVAERPMMPLRIFNDRSAITGYSTSYLQGLVVWCYTYYIIDFFLGAMQHGILHSAAETMTTIAYSAPAGLVASILVKRIGKFKYLVVIGWALLVAGIGSNVTMHPNSSKAVLYAPRCLASIGAGFLFPTPLFAVQARQRDEDIGVATSVQVFARSLGTAFGVALGGVIFQNEWSKLVSRDIAEQKIPQEYFIPSNIAEVAYELVRQFPESVQRQYQWVYSNSLRSVWYVMLGLSVAGFLISLTARDDLLRGGLQGKQNFQERRKERDLEEKTTTR